MKTLILLFALAAVAACSTTVPAEAQSTLGAECTSHAACDAGQYCRTHNPYGCDLDGDWGPGECALPETDCRGVAKELTCGCDGEIYDSVCDAAAAGVNTGLYANSCVPAQDLFACGYRLCQRGAEYCHQELEVEATCLPLPEACMGTATCDACFPDGPGSVCACSDELDLAIECGV